MQNANYTEEDVRRSDLTSTSSRSAELEPAYFAAAKTATAGSSTYSVAGWLRNHAKPRAIPAAEYLPKQYTVFNGDLYKVSCCLLVACCFRS